MANSFDEGTVPLEPRGDNELGGVRSFLLIHWLDLGLLPN